MAEGGLFIHLRYIFGNLIKKYSQRGLEISKKLFDKDIYKESGLLLMNNDLNKFYNFEYTMNKNNKNKKAEKNINFLNKIKKQAQKLYNKRLLERKNFEEEENIIYFNKKNENNANNENNGNNTNNNNDPNNNASSLLQEKKAEIKNKRQNLNVFINIINIILKEIKEEKDEIKKLKKLILEEEKMI